MLAGIDALLAPSRCCVGSPEPRFGSDDGIEHHINAAFAVTCAAYKQKQPEIEQGLPDSASAARSAALLACKQRVDAMRSPAFRDTFAVLLEYLGCSAHGVLGTRTRRQAKRICWSGTECRGALRRTGSFQATGYRGPLYPHSRRSKACLSCDLSPTLSALPTSTVWRWQSCCPQRAILPHLPETNGLGDSRSR